MKINEIQWNIDESMKINENQWLFNNKFGADSRNSAPIQYMLNRIHYLRADSIKIESDSIFGRRINKYWIGFNKYWIGFNIWRLGTTRDEAISARFNADSISIESGPLGCWLCAKYFGPSAVRMCKKPRVVGTVRPDSMAQVRQKRAGFGGFAT